jgi:hypothetical protein
MPLLSVFMAIVLYGVTVHKFASELRDELLLDFVFDISQNFQWMAILIC